MPQLATVQCSSSRQDCIGAVGAIGGMCFSIMAKGGGNNEAQNAFKQGVKLVVQQSGHPPSKSVEEKIETNVDEMTEKKNNGSENLLESTRNLKLPLLPRALNQQRAGGPPLQRAKGRRFREPG
ncbi:hypothetical protein FGO68_gene11029 [Halteria grandinella]|uniref:Uncharacterized protein n=1 Tax=Halteria grandinella TaxID=5974 RepID=A0A8J8T1E3_HALGN|nr:hypothetical protein FGO68_gene11029 [Halteria grandinella]